MKPIALVQHSLLQREHSNQEDRMVGYCDSLDDACRWFKQNVSSAELIGEIQGVKGPICRVYSDGYRRFYVMFKRDWLHSFQYLFKKPGTGWGQTVNMRILRQAALDRDKGLLIAVMPKAAYSLNAKTMMDYVSQNQTTRVPSTEAGEEGSCPSRMWTNILSSL